MGIFPNNWVNRNRKAADKDLPFEWHLISEYGDLVGYSVERDFLHTKSEVASSTVMAFNGAKWWYSSGFLLLVMGSTFPSVGKVTRVGPRGNA